MDVDVIAANLSAVRHRVALAAQRSQRDASSVTLLAVSKRVDVERMLAAQSAGQVDFGENYPQELERKGRDARLHGARLHAIGALQTNKAKIVAEHAVAFHALARLEEALELNKRRLLTSHPALCCFVEVNIANEASKHGVSIAELPDFLAALRRHPLPALEVAGLMCMPPFGEAPEVTRQRFRSLRQLATQVGLPSLSMGTTDDFELAIEEGATHVRVGRAIFGARTTDAGKPPLR